MKKTLLLGGLAMLCTGCVDYQLIVYDTNVNYLAFNHPFTDKAIAEVQAKAEDVCRQRKQLAIQTTKSCSLSKCTTNYQCVDPAGAAKYGL